MYVASIPRCTKDKDEECTPRSRGNGALLISESESPRETSRPYADASPVTARRLEVMKGNIQMWLSVCNVSIFDGKVLNKEWITRSHEDVHCYMTEEQDSREESETDS